MTRERCNICGRFARAERGPDGQVVRNSDGTVARWYLPCVSWDPYMGAYEHD